MKILVLKYPPWDYDNNDPDDGDEENPDERTPFLPPDSSTPEPSGEKIEMKTMQHEKSGRAETSYAETSFGGAQTQSERAWMAAKELFPDMSSSELDVSYNAKGKLQVKMFGAGKKTYPVYHRQDRKRDDK